MLLALLALGLPGRGGAAEIEIYRPSHRPAAELLPLASAVLGPGGRAVVDSQNGWLLLTGEPEALERAVEALRSLDLPLASYRVESVLSRVSELKRAGLEIDGWTEVGDLRVGRVGRGPEGVRIRIGSLASKGSQRFEGQVRVLEGRSAELWTGTVQPARVRTLEERPGGFRVRETTLLVPAQTGFRVVPRSLPDGLVELEIAPIISERRADGTVVRSAAQSRIAVRPGELVAVASLSRVGSSRRIDPFGSLQHTEGAEESLLLVRVELLE